MWRRAVSEWRHARGGLMAAAMLALVLVAGTPVTASDRGPVILTDPLTGLAIGGFDPVAYFIDGKARVGHRDIEGHAFGVGWRFVNDGNRAAFLARPDLYAPRFGGHDPVALGRGVAVGGRPDLFVLARDRLFLFATPRSREAFLADPAVAIAAAEARWDEVARAIAR
jgi:hypothetical protein